MLTLQQIIDKNRGLIGYEKLSDQICLVQEALDLYWTMGTEDGMSENVVIRVRDCSFRMPWCIEKPTCLLTCAGAAMLKDHVFMCVDDRCMKSCCRYDCDPPEYHATHFYHGLNKDPEFDVFALKFAFMDQRDENDPIHVDGKDDLCHKVSKKANVERDECADPDDPCYEEKCENDMDLWSEVSDIRREKGCGPLLVYAVSPDGREEQVAILEPGQESSRVREYRVLNFPTGDEAVVVSGKRPMPHLTNHDLHTTLPIENWAAFRDLICAAKAYRDKNPNEGFQYERIAQEHWTNAQEEKEPSLGAGPAVQQSNNKNRDSSCGDYEMLSLS